MRFSALIAESKSRTEMVATFIALLELCREGKVGIMGEGEEITISKLSEEGGAQDGNEGA